MYYYNMMATEKEKAQIDKLLADGAELDAYIEEICADAYAGMDRFPEEKAKIIKKAAQRAQEAQQAEEENGGTRGPPEKYSVSETDSREQTQDEITAEYQNAVHGILNGTINSKDALLVGYTPDIYRKLGMPDLPFVVGSGHVYSIAKTQDEAKVEGRFRKNTNYHGLGERAVADILQAVKNPVMVISAKDVDRNATPLRSTHSVVALVDVGTNGKSLVVPVSITAQSAVDGTVMDVNMISSVYEKNARGLVNEAIAQFNSGENSIFYVTKKAATLAGEGVQFPSILQAAATSSDGIVRRLDSKINMSIENVTQSQQFKRWFGDWQKCRFFMFCKAAGNTPPTLLAACCGAFALPQGGMAWLRDAQPPSGDGKMLAVEPQRFSRRLRRHAKEPPGGRLFCMVELRGIEPLSENNLTGLSSGTVCYLHSLTEA